VKVPEAPLSGLPFVDVGDAGAISLWSIGLTGGHGHADACVAYVVAKEAPMLLGQVAKAQIALGLYGAVVGQLSPRGRVPRGASRYPSISVGRVGQCLCHLRQADQQHPGVRVLTVV
jgi:hypothetical protein